MRRYYNDVWEFSLEDLKWTPLGPKPGQPDPSPRGGCQLMVYNEQLYMFGGYAVRKAEAGAGGQTTAGYGSCPHWAAGVVLPCADALTSSRAEGLLVRCLGRHSAACPSQASLGSSWLGHVWLVAAAR